MKRTFLYFLSIVVSSCAFFSAKAETTLNFKNGIIYNMQGPKAAAWSLSYGTEKWLHEGDLEKDIINTTKISDRLPFFRRELKGGNGTSFIKLKNFKINQANYSYLSTYFSKHKAATVIKNIKVGDVYLMRLKSSDDYALMKITKIKDDGTSLLYDGNNMDYISFDYLVFKSPSSEAISFIKEEFEEEEQPLWDPEMEVIIYPNPVIDKMYVKFRKSTDNIGWVILMENTNGEKVYESESIYESHWNNSFKDLPEGRYIVSVLKSDKVYVQKIIDKNEPERISSVYP